MEDALVKQSALDALLRCFTTAKANSFENLLDPFLKVLRLSSNVTMAVARSPALFRRIVDRLENTSKPVVRLNLLRILRTVCELHPNRTTLVERYDLLNAVEKLSKNDGAVLVKELAREIIPVLRPGLAPAAGTASGLPSRTPVAKLARRDRPHHVHSASSSSALPRPTEEGVPPTPTRMTIAPKKTRVRRAASETTFVPSPPSTMGATSGPASASGVGNIGSGSSTARFVLPPASQSSRTKPSRARLGDIPWDGRAGGTT